MCSVLSLLFVASCTITLHLTMVHLIYFSCRKIATLQADLCDSTQKVAKVQTEKDEAVLSMQQEMKALQSKHEQDNNEKVQHIETMVRLRWK